MLCHILHYGLVQQVQVPQEYALAHLVVREMLGLLLPEVYSWFSANISFAFLFLFPLPLACYWGAILVPFFIVYKAKCLPLSLECKLVI